MVLTIKILHIEIEHLRYKFLFKLLKFLQKIKIKKLVITKIYNKYIKSYL